ncbi:ral guanine nucleotide dissociation stimulator-like 1 [Hetaerina americana]|uniref:ral guanine nucleotide dissociation stimulator-like 1 n=1 Tax=Hetaerina americana TaxID=62018 RepID=UPI003A7F376A
MNPDIENLRPTWRLWGEERVDGAIYTVYLKKVRYHRPTRSLCSEEKEEDKVGECGNGISHLEWETVRVRLVRAATLERLVEALTSEADGHLESTHANVFLATFRTFATVPQVLGLVVDRYERLLQEDGIEGVPASVGECHRKTLVVVLHVWLDSYPDDFKEPPPYPSLSSLLRFCRSHLPGSELESKVLHRLERLTRDATEGTEESPRPHHLSGRGPSIASPDGSSTNKVYYFPDVPVRHFAEQLTRVDAELFRKVVPHQCLGGEWSRRKGVGNGGKGVASVLATVGQFNAVSFRVISTLLVVDSTIERAKVLSAWIEIAQELRVLKNFSSLKAIISGLQSNPIFRLQRTWRALPGDKLELFEELARIFSEDNNAWTQRELLMREGTAKFAVTFGENDKQLQKILQKQLPCAGTISHGTIPYLGTFLTDLTMIDTAIPDTVADGLINFDKRRKEFEVLAQIKLLQGAAGAYRIAPDPAFDRWFDSVLVLDDAEAYRISCRIEPPTSGGIHGLQNSGGTTASSTGHGTRRRVGLGHQKNDSIASTSSSSSSQFYCDLDSLPSTSPRNSLDRKASPSQMSFASSESSPSPPSPDVSGSVLNNSHGLKHTRPMTPGQLRSPDFYVIRVTVESNSKETEGVVLYKSIMLSNNERTPQVVRNAMMKLCLEGHPDEYTLAQVLPDREMVLPNDANVYYAVNTAHDLDFILRRKMNKGDTPTRQGIRTMLR